MEEKKEERVQTSRDLSTHTITAITGERKNKRERGRKSGAIDPCQLCCFCLFQKCLASYTYKIPICVCTHTPPPPPLFDSAELPNVLSEGVPVAGCMVWEV